MKLYAAQPEGQELVGIHYAGSEPVETLVAEQKPPWILCADWERDATPLAARGLNATQVLTSPTEQNAALRGIRFWMDLAAILPVRVAFWFPERSGLRAEFWIRFLQEGSAIRFELHPCAVPFDWLARCGSLCPYELRHEAPCFEYSYHSEQTETWFPALVLRI